MESHFSIEGKYFHPKAIFFSPKILPTSSTLMHGMAKISAELPCVADQSIPINSHKCEEGKSKFGRKIFLCFFSFLISLFPYAHAQDLCLEGKKYSFLSFVMPTHTILFFPYYTHP
jgi:hypothetical protein